MKTQELASFGGTLTVLGIIFGGADRNLGYAFIGVGILISILSAIHARNEANDRGEPR